MERVASAAGVAKGTLYLYFPGKQELFFACVDWGMRQMQQAVDAAVVDASDGWQRIAQATRVYLAFFAAHAEYAELMIQERANFRDRKRPTYFDHREANLDAWRELYRELITAGEMRADLPVDRLLDTVGGLVYGSMFLNHMTGGTVPLDERCDALLKIVLEGLATDAARPELQRRLAGAAPKAPLPR